MVELTLVRHGESYGAGSYIGRGSDFNLTQKGIVDISSLNIGNQDLIYTSSMARCRESATIIIEKLNNRFEILQDIEEVDFGDWESLTFDQLTNKNPQEFTNWLNNPQDISPPNGETLKELQARVINSISFLKDKITDKKRWRILLITHRGPIAILLLHFLKLDLNMFWNFRIDKASITKIDIYNEWSEVITLNAKEYGQ
ncbi:MAG: histidine phosphatase family protein [Spirochaetales bacterium]|nr:histidine phosphatase family protein [Spirochaetales bacterium]